MSLRLLTLNIEKHRHLELVEELLTNTDANMVCLQEVLADDIPFLCDAFQAKDSRFAPMLGFEPQSSVECYGVALLSRYPLTNSVTRRYFPDEHSPKSLSDTAREHRVLLVGEVTIDGVLFRIITTHFTWTPDGLPSLDQERDIVAMLSVLKTFQEYILVGDFNAPRGGPIFAQLASFLTDNIPESYTSSIDGNLHRSGALPVMVDGFFTTESYRASEVTMISGVSDHCAVIGSVDSVSGVS